MIRIDDSLVMVGDADPPFGDPLALGGTTAGLHVHILDADARFAQARAAGAQEIKPVQDMFYGDRMGMLADPFGHVGVFLTHQEDHSPEEIRQRGEGMLSGDDA